MKKTYGTLIYTDPEYRGYGEKSDKKVWALTCEPHVSTRFKRMFPQVKQVAAKSIEISHSNINCHELLWFIDRFPMKITDEDFEILRKGSTEYEGLCEHIVDILDYNKTPINFELTEPARGYQKTAADLLLNVKGLLLADDVGLGKTVSAICAMVAPNSLPVLVVTVTHLPKQFEAEINRFVPQFRTHIIKKGSPYELKDKKGNVPDILICSYSKLHGWGEELAGKIKYVVFDEIQELRSGEGTNKYAAASLISSEAELSLGLSATPIYNYGEEFFNVINILRPDVLGTKYEFLREWCDSSSKKIVNPEAFGSYLRNEGIMLRRTRKDVGRELPPVTTIVQYVESDPKVLDKIKGKAAELAKIILQSNQDFKGQKLRAAEEFSILMRQSTGIAKAPYVAEFVRLLIESGESVVLYGWHREVYNIWVDRLKEFNPVMYTGSESPAAKERSKTMFLNDESKVFIISLRAGAGLDGLQYHSKASAVVFGELDWSAGVHEQCLGRVDRDGQEKNVLAYYLIADSGSDPIVSDILGIKRQQLRGVIDTDGDLITRLETDSGGVKRMAENYLYGNGLSR